MSLSRKKTAGRPDSWSTGQSGQLVNQERRRLVGQRAGRLVSQEPRRLVGQRARQLAN